jgi:ribosomal protein S4
MRLNNKYKIFYQIEDSLENYRLRILNFKRPKWLKFQKRIFKNSSSKKKKNTNFFYHFCIKNVHKFWDKIKIYYKSGLKIKRLVLGLFDKSFYTKDLVHSSYKLDFRKIFITCLLKLEYRLDIFLCKLKFFNSSFQAKQCISNKFISVNGKFIMGNFFLKAEDVINFFNISTLKLKQSNNYFVFRKSIILFAEIDYYTYSVILVKNLFDFSFSDLCLLRLNYYNIKVIKDFFV